MTGLKFFPDNEKIEGLVHLRKARQVPTAEVGVMTRAYEDN
jgi:hypothetical protein